MLQVSAIEGHLNEMTSAFAKRGIKNIENQLRDVLQLNDQRKSNQQELDAILQESNMLAKQIGQLYKEGKREEGDTAKAQTTSLKERSKY